MNQIEVVQRQDFTKFWLVWNPNGHAPTYRHLTKEAAKTEAARLARSNPLHQFCVMECIGAVMQKPPPVFWFDATEQEIEQAAAEKASASHVLGEP